MEITKNDEYTFKIDSYTSEGSGVGRVGTYPVFVPETVRGDIIKAKILKAGKTYAFGKCIEILTPSEERTEPICPHFHLCGGCAIMHMSASERSYFKRQKVYDALSHIGSIENPDVAATETAEDEGYRNKTQMPVFPDYTQAMYKPRSNIKVSVPECKIQSPEAKKVTSAILSYLKDKKIDPYDPISKSGIVRHVYTRVSGDTGNILAIVVATKKIPLSPLAEILPSLGVTGLLLNINESEGNKILGEKTLTIFGSDHITDRLCGTDFDIYPDSFFQVNRFLTERLYNKAVKLAALSGKETVFDLYCGAGTLTAALAKHAKRVIGVEIVPSAVKSAKESLSRAEITNAEIILGESETKAPNLIKEGIIPSCVVVDPPRKGCGEPLIKMLLEIKCPRIVYVSCDPATLARDVKALTKGGYTLNKAYPFDMFPFTHHVETVALLTLNK